VIGSGWGGECSAEVDVCSVVGRVSGGESARAGRGGLGRGRACIECDGERDETRQAEGGSLTLSDSLVCYPGRAGITGWNACPSNLI
jgi:hypothetical protein